MKPWGAVVMAMALAAPSSFASIDVDPPDTTAPVVTIATGMRYAEDSATLITATATDNVGVIEMHLYLDGALVASSWVGTISYGWGNAIVGKHKIRITATDAAQNVGSAVATLRMTSR